MVLDFYNFGRWWRYFPIRFIYPTFQKVDRKFERKGKTRLKSLGTSNQQCCFSAFFSEYLELHECLQKERNKSRAISFVFCITERLNFCCWLLVVLCARYVVFLSLLLNNLWVNLTEIFACLSTWIFTKL